jgi:hypothetical protein
MHFRTHTKPESLGQAGRWLGPYADTMIDHDKNVGTVLATGPAVRIHLPPCGTLINKATKFTTMVNKSLSGNCI